MGFTKLDPGIILSSVMSEKDSVFKIWIVLLASCGPDGVARISSAAIAKIAGKELCDVDEAIKILSSPDPRSRSKASKGKRIRRVDGGYLLINYKKYREFSHGDPGSSGAARTRKWREKKKSVTVTSHGVTSASASLLSSSSSSLEDEFTKLWDSWPIQEGKEAAFAEFKELKARGVTIEEIEKAWQGEMEFLKHERLDNHFERRPKNLASWLRGDSWKEHIGFKRKPRL
jgi:hypothetical protein